VGARNLEVMSFMGKIGLRGGGVGKRLSGWSNKRESL